MQLSFGLLTVLVAGLAFFWAVSSAKLDVLDTPAECIAQQPCKAAQQNTI
ncbi:MAG: nitrogen fixation-related uncharacterized protein [Gammaproteobacteria bacterium]